MCNKPGVVQLKGGDLRHFKVKGRFDDQRDLDSRMCGEESIRCAKILAKAQVLYCNIHAIPCHIYRFGSCR